MHSKQYNNIIYTTEMFIIYYGKKEAFKSSLYNKSEKDSSKEKEM